MDAIATVTTRVVIAVTALIALVGVALLLRPAPLAGVAEPVTPSTVLSETWSVATAHPTAAEVAACGDWLPVTVYTRAGGQTVSQDACDPNRDARTVNDAAVGALVG